jgi:DNA (cytosine-5)-methyltransferase 1
MKRRKRQRRRTMIDAVDLFCGAGGLSLGLAKEKISVRAGLDLDPACEWPFKKNVRAKFHRQDVALLSGRSLKRHFRRRAVKLLAGCAPCQKFSSYTQKTSRASHRWHLLDSFTRVVLELNPDVITMENVPGLARHRRFKTFLRVLKNEGYETWHDLIECADYGLPQRRQRVVVLASKLGRPRLLTPKEYGAEKTAVKHAISSLPKVDNGQSDKSDPLHRASALSSKNMARITASRPGGTWRDWPDKLVLPCHRKKSGAGYPSIYGRMRWDQQAPTITTLAYNYGSGRFGHPIQNRAITLREAALLQSFPRNYQFAEPNKEINVRTIGRLIGNAVPVTLGRVIGRSIYRHVKDALNAQRKPRRRAPK